MKISIFSKKNATACEHYRAILPHRHLESDLKSRGVDLSISFGGGEAHEFDGVIILRGCHSDLLRELLFARSSGLLFSMDIDDDLLSVPEWSPAKVDRVTIEKIVALRVCADFVWASTNHLASRMRSIENCKANSVSVLPNLVDLNEWGESNHPKNSDRIKIIWSGSLTHDKDLSVAEDAISFVLNKYPQVDLVLMGCPSSKWLEKFRDRHQFFPWCSLEEYPKQMKSAEAHIGICPLVDERFNHSKSAIKFLEYTLAGAAVVASQLPPYQIGDSNLMLYADSTESWIANLSRLIEDHHFRRAMQRYAMGVVKKQWSWQHSPHKVAWLAAYLELAGQPMSLFPKSVG